MSEETQEVEAEEARVRKVRTPSKKNWVAVTMSQGNQLPNTTVKLIYNEATKMCELHTNAPAKEASWNSNNIPRITKRNQGILKSLLLPLSSPKDLI